VPLDTTFKVDSKKDLTFFCKLWAQTGKSDPDPLSFRLLDPYLGPRNQKVPKEKKRKMRILKAG
jgi:hypothetical protein